MERFRKKFSDSGTRFLKKPLSGSTIQTPDVVEIDKPGDELPEDLKGPLGLNLLYAPAEPLIDFVFVHGLGGGSRKSWSKSTNPYHYWPKEWLPRDTDFKNVRIHSFGYNSTWTDRKDSVLDIHDFAHSLIGELKDNPEIRSDDTRIVLIGHSMGGLVIKQVCILANQDPVFSDLMKRIHAVYFLATPHRGSDLAKLLANIVKVCFGQKPFVDDLKRSSGTISALNDGFYHCSKHLQLWSFYETQKSNILISDAIIVDKNSATLGYANERIALLNADHRRVCKFDLPSDSNYKTLRNAFSSTVSDITAYVSEIRQERIHNELRRLRTLLGDANRPTDDLPALEDARIAGSCEWLTSRNEFEHWRTVCSADPSVLWLSGNPGSGKSILASHVISHLEGHNLQYSFFFFKHGTDTKSTVGDCLRSLAYQMCLSSPEVRKRLLALEAEGVLVDETDEKAIWRKMFLGGIFQTRSNRPHYWVIDALDECTRFQGLFSMLSKLETQILLRVFITSRKTRDIGKGFADLGKSVISLEMQANDTLDDVKLFITSRIGHLPLRGDADREKLINRILSKSAGCFLWVELVLRELEHAWSKEAVDEVLDEIPSDMNMWYARTLESISKDRASVKLAKAMLTWATCAARPLTTTELQNAIRSDIQETIYDMERSIASVCGQLLYVDQDSRVQVIHQTARDFILQEDSSPEFSIRKESGNFRLAMVCLDLLSRETFKAPKLKPPTKAVSTKASPLATYACYYFSDHFYRASSAESQTMDSLCNFLNTNVLSWIEFIARTGDLYHITRTAMNLKAYLDYRSKYFPPIGLQLQTIEGSILDLIRVSAKFRLNLLDSPSSIQSLIPQLCPRDSMIAKKFALPCRGLLVKGIQETTWSDCLAQFDYPGRQVTTVASGDRYLAVGLSSGQIVLYHNVSYQSYRTIDHTKRIEVLAFSNFDKLLASSSRYSVRVWDISNGSQISIFDTSRQVLDMKFSSESDYLVAATEGNYVAYWGLKEGCEDSQIPWCAIAQESSTSLRHTQPASIAVFSSDQNFVGVCCRGHPILIFDLDSEAFFGHCIRHSNPIGRGANAHSLVKSLVFNPSPEIRLIVASYADGELVVYDLWTLEVKQRLPKADAHSMVCSPDGRTLVTGNSSGTIQVFDFGGDGQGDSLSLIYRINAYEGIKSLAFSKDSRRFMDIRGSQCRIWEPAVLVRKDLLDGSQSEISDPAPYNLSTVGMREGEKMTNITAVACHGNGEVVFCGKQDGSVVVVSTQDAIELCMLYKHANNIAVTCILWAANGSMLATADQSGRIIISKIQGEVQQWSATGRLLDQRFDGAVISMLMDASNKYVLISGRDTTELWTSSGSKIVTKQLLPESFRGAIRHPTCPELFVIFEADMARIYKWADYSETTRSTAGIETIRTTPSQGIDSLSTTSYHVGQRLLIEFTSTMTRRVPRRLELWSTSPLSTESTVSLLPVHLDISLLLGPRIQHVIALIDNDTKLLFLDLDLWVCSVDLRSFAITRRAERHFFIPSDWRNHDLSPGEFLFYFNNAKREFVFAKGSELLIIKRGLDYTETIEFSDERERLSTSFLRVPVRSE